jgi:hypothetical protein
MYRRRIGLACSAAVIGAAVWVGMAADVAVAMVRPSPLVTTHLVKGLATVLPGTRCQIFPSNNVWNTPVTGLPVNTHSATWLASMSASTTFLHPDYGPSGNSRQPYGIPFVVVRNATTFTRLSFLYASESDRRPYPLTASTTIEGGSDRHALMVDPYRSASSAPCTLFETYGTHYRSAGRSTAGSGAIWNLNSNALRPLGYTSADAAGLPIFPGLVNYAQVASHAMHHAIRFTVACSQQSYVWPARHEAGQAAANCPPMGARFRLNAPFTLPTASCAAFCQTVIATMKTYGLILADNGSNWYFQGTVDTRWTSVEVDQLKQIPASQFVAVDESCLRVNAQSGQALQPGTPAYAASCATPGT